MAENTSNNQNKYAHVDMKTVDSFLDKVERILEELISKANQLPKIDENGFSECPFAEELYAYKEKAARNLEKAIKRLRQYILPVEREIERCRQNLKKISSDRQKLHDDEAKKNYNNAKEAQLSEYNQAIQRRKRLFEIIQKADKELEKAKEKKWPPGDLKEQNSFNPESASGSIVTPRNNGMPNHNHRETPVFEKEINSLISMGPIGGN
ncbi:MAG: hypothetical protein HF978_06370 [Desulfobacteraceae bacterium]|nr:hypothetical protein [Desulfobacteraceae bacterium]MBC2755155.1 hypothetical protein [Desulfobacteraceae bacterium]